MKLIDKVNIKQGTASMMRFSKGNTLPLVTLPHSLAMFAPQTDGSRGGWFYHPADRSFEGIRLTHQPSPWIGDYSYLTFMPQSGEPCVSANERWSGFRPEKAELHPHYMRFELLRYGAAISLASTNSGAAIKLEFKDYVVEPRFAVTPADFYGEINVDLERGEISGYTTSNNGRPRRRFKCYFIFKFNAPFTDAYVTNGKNAVRGTNRKGKAAGANVGLSQKCTEAFLATSYIGYEQARLNLEREACSYDEAKQRAEACWEDVLGRVEVEGNAEDTDTFYSCMYRAFVFPNKLYEVDVRGEAVHVVPETGKLKKGVLYTNNGFWDTFRTVYPLYSLIAPKECTEIVKGWLNFFDDTGYLPRWTSPSESGCMPGTLVEAVLADATVKNLLSKDDAKRALTAMLKNAEVPSGNSKQGRKCVYEYETLGYVPYDKCYESVNETLDCAYGDYCIAQVAEYLGEAETAKKYKALSKNYKNLFDKSVGFMRARASDGSFRKDFDCNAWGRDYTEGSAWQTTLSVQHDIAGLSELYGGREKFFEFIDKLVAAEPRYTRGGYGGEIHEMTEMASVDFGQCAISNQPSFHIPYVYAELGEKAKTVSLVRRLQKALFSAGDGGFPGDEDNGTMASWYIFSALGFYPLCPGRADYVVAEPLFERTVMHLPTGDVDVIERLKGKSKILHSEIIKK